MSRKSVNSKTGRLRIIAGQWRGRLIEFEDQAGLRPTGDRIRETLFNWLQSKIPTSRCLDLYAGSGALGIEAVSRGAIGATLIDNNPSVIARLRVEIEKLGADSINIEQSAAQGYLSAAGLKSKRDAENRFDIVFIDPPFDDESQLDTLQQCADAEILNAGALVYVEARDTALLEEHLPEAFSLLKFRRAGRVQYLLLEYQQPTAIN